MMECSAAANRWKRNFVSIVQPYLVLEEISSSDGVTEPISRPIFIHTKCVAKICPLFAGKVAVWREARQTAIEQEWKHCAADSVTTRWRQ